MKKLVKSPEVAALESKLAAIQTELDKAKSSVVEVEGEGLESLLGKQVILFCLNYIYTGTLIGVNKTFCKLGDAAIVYATGAFKDTKFADAQRLSNPEHSIMLSAIESYGLTKQTY